MPASHAKTDNLLLVATKQRVHFSLTKQGQMGERRETAIGDQDIFLIQFGMHDSRVSQVVGVQRRGDQVEEQAGAGMEEGQQVSHRKTASLGLRQGLTEVRLQFRRVGHGETGTIQRPGAMAPPPTGRVHFGKEGIANMGQEFFE